MICNSIYQRKFKDTCGVDVSQTRGGNMEGSTPLHTACKNGDLARVKKLVSEGADVNKKDKLGYTPIHDCILQGVQFCIHVLVPLEHISSTILSIKNSKSQVSHSNSLFYA